MMATGGGALAGAGAVVNGTMAIANELGAVYQHSLQPNSAKGNVNGGDINVCDHKNGFYFYKMTIKEEYARIIDNYFVGSDLTEIINNEEYIINYYNIYYIFDNDKINKISDYSDYRFNKHIEFIKRRTFIKILLKDYEFKFREIQ